MTKLGTYFRMRLIPALVVGLIGAAAVVGLISALGADGEGAYTVKRGQFESYLLDKQSAAYRTAISSGDSVTDWDAISSVATYSLTDSSRQGCRQNLSVSARFSNSGATATVWVGFYYYDGSTYQLLGIDQPMSGGSVTTIDATAARVSSSGDYISHTYVFDTYGATHALVLVSAISAGNVDLWVGSF